MKRMAVMWHTKKLIQNSQKRLKNIPIDFKLVRIGKKVREEIFYVFPVY